MRYILFSIICVIFAAISFAQVPSSLEPMGGPKGNMERVPQPPDTYPEIYQPPPMVFIPEGEYEMGDHRGSGHIDEKPVHAVYIDAFYMDTFEVTNQEYSAYLNAAYKLGLIEVIGDVVYMKNGDKAYCTTNSTHGHLLWDGNVFSSVTGKEEHPLVKVTWYGAVAYANWRSESQGLTPCYDPSTWRCTYGVGGYRLPTEAEWEKAARGGEHNPYYIYPWGDFIDGSMANYVLSGDPYELEPDPKTTPVGYYNGHQMPAGDDMGNGYGLYDMAGNVWEWCNDWYENDYYSYSPYDNPKGPSSSIKQSRVLRGGSWNSCVYILRCACRTNFKPAYGMSNIGFRLVLEITE